MTLEKAKILGWREIRQKPKKEKISSGQLSFLGTLLLAFLMVYNNFPGAVVNAAQTGEFLENAKLTETSMDAAVQKTIRQAAVITSGKGGGRDGKESTECNGTVLPEGIKMARHCMVDKNEKFYPELTVSFDDGKSWQKAAILSTNPIGDVGTLRVENTKTVRPVSVAPQAEVTRRQTLFVQSYLRDEKGNFVYQLEPVEALGFMGWPVDTGLVIADGVRLANQKPRIRPGTSGSGIFTADGRYVAVLVRADQSTGPVLYVAASVLGFDSSSYDVAALGRVAAPTFPNLSGLYSVFPTKR